MNELNMCTQCGKAPASVEKGAMRLCESCAIEESRKLFKVVAGGKLITPEKPTLADVKEVVKDFIQHGQAEQRNKFVQSYATGAEVIFVDNQQNKRLIRITESEEAKIINDIVKNRSTSQKEFMFADVAMFPVGIAIKLDEIVKLAAKEDSTVFEKAKVLLNELTQPEPINKI